MNFNLTEIFILTPPLLLALTLHEFSHGYVANRLGDPTARQLGRLSLNPLKHLDPIGTLAFLLLKIGWAKPIPVNPHFFQHPQKDMLWVALAGPLSNLVLAVLSAIFAKLTLLAAPLIPIPAMIHTVLGPLLGMLIASVWINLVLCVFNLLPIPPLDGSKILVGLLPPHLAASFLKIEKYGFILILVLAFSGVLSRIILPLIHFANNLLLA